MEVQEILSGKEKLISYLKEKGFQEEKEYSDDEYKEGSYFKIDKRKLLVIYEVFEEEKIKEIKDHFLIDRGLSYCVIILDGKLIFLRNFGETKHFIYSERTKNNVSKLDKLKNISALDSLFQSKDISSLFYEAFKVKRNLLVQNIKNDVEPVQKYLIAQKIFDRFFFIYFLCHKGIIKFKDGGKISGENLFTKILLKKGKFLENLKKLFHLFNSQEKTILEIGDYQIVIPYLNGGLFRPDVLEQDLDIKLKDEQWEEIFEFLNSYHWIIEDVRATEENEEKILTPEILGHVYERSVVEWESEGFEKEAENAVKKITERKKKGVYYTPESITDYISNNTIIPYLLDKLGNKYVSFDELIESKSKKDMKDAVKILDEIKVLDPACGSGAFLIKASEVMLSLKRRLNYEIKEKKNFYDLKLDIITENIYGVDILAGAIEISKLRLWLWLISDFEESKNEIKALPNIEYNLKVGNSLVGWLDEKLVQMPMNTPLTEKVDGIFTGLIAFSENGDGEDLKKARELLRAYKLTDYIEAYYILYKIYRRTHGLKAENLRSILETIKKSIYATVTPAFLDYVNAKIKPKYDKKNPPISQEEFSGLQVFHWRIDFGHIILNGGFDVVIGNPPYIFVRGKRFGEKEKTIYQKMYFSEVTSATQGKADQAGKVNSFSVFVERGYNTTKSNGFLGYITPNTLLRVTTYNPVRQFILSKSYIESIVDLKAGIFQGVTASTIIMLLRKCKNKQKSLILELSEDEIVKLKEFNQDEFLGNTNFVFNIFSDSEDDVIIDKIENGSISLGEETEYIIEGIVGNTKKDVVDSKINEKCKKFLVGKDIGRYVIKYKGKFIIYDRNRLHRARPEEIFTNEKIIIQRISGGNMPLTCVLDREKYYTFASTNLLLLKKISKWTYQFVTALLNSKLINWYYVVQFTNKSTLTVNISKTFLEKIPFKLPKDQQPFIKLVDEILSITKDKDYLENEQKQKKVKELQDKIDQLIYKLYGLSPEEIKIVEEFCEK